MPFLNRFEKYAISVPDILTDQLKENKELESTINKLRDRCLQFVKHVGEQNFYGFTLESTISSLFIDLVSQVLKKNNSETNLVDFIKFKKETVNEYTKKLMRICSPEALINCPLPQDYLTDYLGKQEHFELNQFLLKLNESENSSKFTRNIIFTRSTPDILSLEDKKELLFDENLCSLVKIIDVSTFSSEKDILEQIKDFYSCQTKQFCIFSVDRQKTSQRIVNRVRQLIEDQILSIKKKTISKHSILIMHFPGGWMRLKKDCYPSLFLHGWDFTFMDSIGRVNQLESRSVKEILKNLINPPKIIEEVNFDIFDLPAENEEINLDINETIIDKLFEESLTNVVCNLVPSSFNEVVWQGDLRAFYHPKSKPGQRREALQKLFSCGEIKEKILEKFQEIWCEQSIISQIIKETAKQLISKHSSDSFSYALNENLNTLFGNYLSILIEQISSNYNLQTLHESSKNENTLNYVLSNFTYICPNIDLQSIKERKFSEKQIGISFYKYPPKCPFSSNLIERISLLLEEVLIESTDEDRTNYEKIAENLSKKFKFDDKYSEVYSYLEEIDNSSIFELFLEDVLYSKILLESLSENEENNSIQKEVMKHWVLSLMKQKNSISQLFVSVTFESKSWSSFSLVLKPILRYLKNFETEELKTNDFENFKKKFLSASVDTLWEKLVECHNLLTDPNSKDTQNNLENWVIAFQSVSNFIEDMGEIKGKFSQKISLMQISCSLLIASKCDFSVAKNIIEKVVDNEKKDTGKAKIKDQFEWVESCQIPSNLKSVVVRSFSEDLLLKFSTVCTSITTVNKFKTDMKYLLEAINEENPGCFPGGYWSFNFKFQLYKTIEKYIKNKATGNINLKLFKEEVEQMMSNCITKKENVQNYFQPPIVYSPNRKSCPLADIYYLISLKKAKTKKKESQDNFWTYLFR